MKYHLVVGQIKKKSFFTISRRQWHPTPVLLPGKSHGQRSLVGHSPWDHKESDTTERLHLFLFTYYKTFPFQSLILFFLLKKMYYFCQKFPPTTLSVSTIEYILIYVHFAGNQKITSCSVRTSLSFPP